jgi:hypothetical protein
LQVERQYLHFPNVAISRFIVPAETVSLNYFASSIASERTVAHRAAKRILPSLPVRTLTAAFPNISMILRKPGAQAFLSWLADAGQAEHGAPVVISRSWRPTSETATLHLLNSSTGAPVCIAKLARTEDEAIKLRTIASAAQTTTVSVPEVVATKTLVEPWKAIVQSPVDGRTLQAEIQRGRISVEYFLSLLADWLTAWHQSTRHVDECRWQHVRSDLLARARPLLNSAQNPLIASYDPAPPLVAVHNDLTMWNLRLNGRHLGVLDWEASDEHGLPLTDFFYAAADAVAARGAYADRLSAMTACFSPEGLYAPMIAECVKRIARTLELGPDCIGLAFCACWIHHASNEAQLTSDGARPFLGMMHWAVNRREQFQRWIGS